MEAARGVSYVNWKGTATRMCKLCCTYKVWFSVISFLMYKFITTLKNKINPII